MNVKMASITFVYDGIRFKFRLCVPVYLSIYGGIENTELIITVYNPQSPVPYAAHPFLPLGRSSVMLTSSKSSLCNNNI